MDLGEETLEIFDFLLGLPQYYFWICLRFFDTKPKRENSNIFKTKAEARIQSLYHSLWKKELLSGLKRLLFIQEDLQDNFTDDFQRLE